MCTLNVGSSSDKSIHHSNSFESNRCTVLRVCICRDILGGHIRYLRVKRVNWKCFSIPKFLVDCSWSSSICLPQETTPTISCCLFSRCTISGPPESPWRANKKWHTIAVELFETKSYLAAIGASFVVASAHHIFGHNIRNISIVCVPSAIRIA